MCVHDRQGGHDRQDSASELYELRDLLVLLDDVAHRLSLVVRSDHTEEVIASVSQHRQMVARWLASPPSRTVQTNAASTILTVIANANAAAHAAFLDTGSWRPVQAELRAAQHSQPDAAVPLFFSLTAEQGVGVAKAVLAGDLVPTPLDWLPRAGTQRVCEVTVDGIGEPLLLVAECVGIETPDGVLLEMAPASPRQKMRLEALAEGRAVPTRPTMRDELPTITEAGIDTALMRARMQGLAAEPETTERSATSRARFETEEMPLVSDAAARSPHPDGPRSSSSIDRLLAAYMDEPTAQTRIPSAPGIPQIEAALAAPVTTVTAVMPETHEQDTVPPWQTPITLPPAGLVALQSAEAAAPVTAVTAVTARPDPARAARTAAHDVVPVRTGPLPQTPYLPPQPPAAHASAAHASAAHAPAAHASAAHASAAHAPAAHSPVAHSPVAAHANPWAHRLPPGVRDASPSHAKISPAEIAAARIAAGKARGSIRPEQVQRARELVKTQELPDIMFAKAPVGAFKHHSDVAHIEPIGPTTAGGHPVGGPTVRPRSTRGTLAPLALEVDGSHAPRAVARAGRSGGAWLLAGCVALGLLASPAFDRPASARARAVSPVVSTLVEHVSAAAKANADRADAPRANAPKDDAPKDDAPRANADRANADRAEAARAEANTADGKKRP